LPFFVIVFPHDNVLILSAIKQALIHGHGRWRGQPAGHLAVPKKSSKKIEKMAVFLLF